MSTDGSNRIISGADLGRSAHFDVVLADAFDCVRIFFFISVDIMLADVSIGIFLTESVGVISAGEPEVIIGAGFASG